jgi:hypothetical protein
MFFGISDVFQAWEQLSGNVMAIAGSKAKGSNGVDHSYITPTIIGEFELEIFICDNHSSYRDLTTFSTWRI